MNKLIYIMLLNEIIHDLMHNEYLLINEKVVNKNVYTQLAVNKNNINLFYIKHMLTLKKLIITFFNVAELNFMFYKLKNKFKNFSSDDFHLNKTLNLMSFFIVNKNFIIKKLKKLKLLINEKHKIIFFMINENFMLKKLKRLKSFQHLNKSKKIVIVNSNNIKTENE